MNRVINLHFKNNVFILNNPVVNFGLIMDIPTLLVVDTQKDD